MKKNSKITPEQERIINTIHNLVWFRIANDKRYFNAIPEIDSPDFSSYIYYIKYESIEEEDSKVCAVLYLNGKHYDYVNLPQFLNSVWVDEIEDSAVKEKIIEFGGKIYDGFELYNETSENCEVLDEMLGDVKKRSELDDDDEYYDLPF